MQGWVGGEGVACGRDRVGQGGCSGQHRGPGIPPHLRVTRDTSPLSLPQPLLR